MWHKRGVHEAKGVTSRISLLQVYHYVDNLRNFLKYIRNVLDYVAFGGVNAQSPILAPSWMHTALMDSSDSHPRGPDNRHIRGVGCASAATVVLILSNLAKQSTSFWLKGGQGLMGGPIGPWCFWSTSPPAAGRIHRCASDVQRWSRYSFEARPPPIPKSLVSCLWNGRADRDETCFRMQPEYFEKYITAL